MSLKAKTPFMVVPETNGQKLASIEWLDEELAEREPKNEDVAEFMNGAVPILAWAISIETYEYKTKEKSIREWNSADLMPITAFITAGIDGLLGKNAVITREGMVIDNESSTYPDAMTFLKERRREILRRREMKAAGELDDMLEAWGWQASKERAISKAVWRH